MYQGRARVSPTAISQQLVLLMNYEAPVGFPLDIATGERLTSIPGGCRVTMITACRSVVVHGLSRRPSIDLLITGFPSGVRRQVWTVENSPGSTGTGAATAPTAPL